MLDAGCGTGYGLRILQDAGAARVTGIDISAEAVAKASASHDSDRIEVIQGDVGELPFSDGELDMVVCFEVIEHVTDRDAILDELTRVLGADGILCISTPNRRVYPSGNPYHIHEYEPEEFAQALGERFPHVALHRQAAWLTSAILSDSEFATASESFSSRTIKAEPKKPGEEIFTVALAARRKMPPPQALLSLGEPFEVRWWQEQVQAAGAKGHELASLELQRAIAARKQATAAREEALRQSAVLRQEATTARESSLISAKRLLEIEENLAKSKARIFALEEALDARGAFADQMQRAGRARRSCHGRDEGLDQLADHRPAAGAQATALAARHAKRSSSRLHAALESMFVIEIIECSASR